MSINMSFRASAKRSSVSNADEEVKQTKSSTAARPKIRSKVANGNRAATNSARFNARSVKSTEPQPVLTSKHKPKPPKSKSYEEDFTDDDIRFINVDKTRTGSARSVRSYASEGMSSPAGSARGSCLGNEEEQKGKEILEKSQESDPLKVYEIDLRTSDIGRISNLEKFTKLRVLDLSSNRITQVDNLYCNQDLRELKLYDNKIQVIENLNNLKELCHLQLQHNKIKSVGKSLSHLKKLKILRLDSNCILKIDPGELAPCVMMTSLDLSNNKLDNLAALNSLPNLEELYATGNRLRSVPDLGRCKKLYEIDLSSNRITDVSGLKGLTKLSSLNLSNNHLSTLKSLGKLKALKELYLINNRIIDVKTISENFSNLELLNLSENKIDTWKEVCYVTGLQELVELFIFGNPFCSESGPKMNYHADIQKMMPSLDIIDGALTKKPSVKSSAPVMRPMSANTVVSSRQIEAQMNTLMQEMTSYESNLNDKFEALRTSFKFLPEESPSSARGTRSTPSESRPRSRCGTRSKLQEAKLFAEQHF